MQNHHGIELHQWSEEILSNPEFPQKIIAFLKEVDYMETFYSWSKERQREIEAEYYIQEKKLLSYIATGLNEAIKHTLVVALVKIYKTLVYKYVGWYHKSQFNSIGYSSDEVQTTLEAILVDTVYNYISKFNEVRIPFGAFLKRRLFIQFRGELQDVYRKTMLYEQWKDRLYQKSLPNKSREEQIQEFDDVQEKMLSLKNIILHMPGCQKKELCNSFMYNYILSNFIMIKRSLGMLALYDKQGIKLKPIIAEVKADIKALKERYAENKNN